jgi:hypothetical protein
MLNLIPIVWTPLQGSMINPSPFGRFFLPNSPFSLPTNVSANSALLARTTPFEAFLTVRAITLKTVQCINVFSSFTTRITAGPSTTRNRGGKIKMTKGKANFTPALFARSSACCRILVRSVSE